MKFFGIFYLHWAYSPSPAKVAQLHLAVGVDQDIPGRDVSVYDPSRMEVVERDKKIVGYHYGLLLVQLNSVSHDLAQV